MVVTHVLLLYRQRVSTILHLEDAQRTQRNPDRTQKPDIIDRYSQYSSGVYAPMQREGRFPDSRPVNQRIDTRPYQPSTYAELLELEASLPQRHLIAKVQVRKVPSNQSSNQSINQSINMFNDLGANWDPTDNKVQFSEFIQTRFASHTQSVPCGGNISLWA